MRNLKKFENFDGFAADEEADQMNNDQIYADRDAQDAQDAQAFGGQESQEEEGLELDEVVDRVLAVIDECGEDCEEEELRDKVKAVLADFHQEESQEEEDDNYENDEDDSDYISGYDDEEGHEDVQHFEGLKKFFEFNEKNQETEVEVDEEGFTEDGYYVGFSDSNYDKVTVVNTFSPRKEEEENEVQVDEEGFDEFGHYVGFSDSNYDKITVNPNIGRKEKEGHEDVQHFEGLKKFSDFK